MLRRFAFYDLDKTVLRHATFTPFLIFAARRRALWRVALLPVWIGAMIGYKLGLYARQTLKNFGLRLFLGRGVTEADLVALGEAFTDHVIPRWVAPGAAAAMQRDRAEQRELVLVTAAMRFYAEIIGRRLGFAEVIATDHAFDPESHAVRVEGDNCYGAAKVARVEAMLDGRGIDGAECDCVFYSDSASDAPLFDWCRVAVLVNGSAKARRKAGRRGWEVTRFY